MNIEIPLGSLPLPVITHFPVIFSIEFSSIETLGAALSIVALKSFELVLPDLSVAVTVIVFLPSTLKFLESSALTV